MQTRTLASVIAIISAVVAFFSRPVLGFFLGLAAVLFGLIGALRATSRTKSGALPSILAILLGVVAVIVKIVEGALRLIF